MAKNGDGAYGPKHPDAALGKSEGAAVEALARLARLAWSSIRSN